jgi:hypothetical protein
VSIAIDGAEQRRHNRHGVQARGGRMKSFAELQAGLGPALAANTPGSRTPHVVVALPSYSLGESLLSHYADRIPALEHRYLLGGLMVHRIADRAQVDHFAVVDTSSRCLAEKLLDRPELIKQLRKHVGTRSVVIEPWNVTEHEVAIAEQLQAPMNGLDPALRHLGFKSSGRRLFAAAGVPVAYGREDIRTIDDVVAAIEAIRAARARIVGVVVKHDDSGAGDGNAVINLREASTEPTDTDVIRRRVEALPEWYVTDLRGGGVVEELITGTNFASPSVQIDLLPDAEVVMLATHESGRWNLYTLEVNLRKGGTTHPYAALRNLVPGATTPPPGGGSHRTGIPVPTAAPTTWSTSPGSECPLMR